MLSANSRIFFPDPVEISRRANEYVYWAPRRRVAVKVGPAGDRILQACRESNSAAEIVDHASRALNLHKQDHEGVILAFLTRMIDLDFLSEDATQPSPRKPQPASAFRPIILYLHLSVHCNLSCSYCYNVEHRKKAEDTPSLTRAEYLDVIEEAAANGVKQMNFTGGEPLLSRDWPFLVRRAKDLGVSTGLLTNAAVISDRNAATIAELFDKTIVSLDSAVPEEHDAQRGRGSHAQTLRGIQALRRAGYTSLVLRPVLTRHNLDSLVMYPAFAAEQCGTTQILLSPYAPNSVEEERDLQLLPRPADLRRATAAFTRALEEVGGKPQADDEGEVREARRCGAGSGIVSVDFNGDVYPCQAVHDPAMKMGNVREMSLFAMGDTGPSRSFREADFSKIDICKTCNFNEICGGGCRAIAFSVFRSMAAHNPYVCEANKAQAWDRIWAGLASKPVGGAINPADQNCRSGSCSSACG